MRVCAWLLPGLILLCNGCLLPPETHSSDNGERGFGKTGPLAVTVLHESMRLGAEGFREVTLSLPLTRVDDPSSLPEQVPGIVFIPGGLVQRDRYVWLARHLGSRGFAVVIPEYTAWLAFFEPGIAAAALDHLEVRLGERLGNTAMMGHSLGGVMAVKGLMADERLDALVLLASQADEADAIADENRPLLTLAGTLDESIGPQRVRPTFEQWGGTAIYGEVDTLTHFSWTDPGRDPTVLREQEQPSPDLDGARHSGTYLVDAFLEWKLRADPAGERALQRDPAPPGSIIALDIRP